LTIIVLDVIRVGQEAFVIVKVRVPSPIALHEPVKDAEVPDPDEDVTKLEGLNDHVFE
jgi:hypothetical protein